MINHLFLIINLLLVTKYKIVQTQTIKTSEGMCVDNHLQIISINPFDVCYLNDISDNSIVVWFTIEESLNDTFDFYRFILRSSDKSLSSNGIIKLLTNFTELIDLKNSLRIFNLNSNEYDVCIEFDSNRTKFIYQPRDGCISIEIGKSSHETLKHTPGTLLIALAVAIILFFILGLVVQWAKGKYQKKQLDDDKPRTRSSSILSAITSKEQRDRFVRNLFHRHIDQPRASRMRQWARSRAFRHRVSTPEHEFEKPRIFRKRSRQLFPSTDRLSEPRSRTGTISRTRTPSLGSMLTTNNIYTISENEHTKMPSKRPSFHLSPTEEYEMV